MVEAVPERLHTLNVRLVFDGTATEAIRFYGDAFGAELVDEPHLTPDGSVVHAEIRVGDTVVFVTDEGDGADGAVSPRSAGDRVTAVLALNIPNVDDVWARATGAGCEVIYPLADQFYGDRGGRLRDPFGHQWMLSTHIEDVSRDEMNRRAEAMGGG
ncbi:MAG TPA: VOC family protein [Acidimicrobiia bacterium]|jgi:PhnB protein